MALIHGIAQSGTPELWLQQAPSERLRALLDAYGSDKGSLGSAGYRYPWPPHTYADVYASLFDHCRDSVRLVVECGIGTSNVSIPSNMTASGVPGASLRAWRDYFPKAEIVGGDIDGDILFQESRISTFHLDQTDPGSIRSFWDHVGDSPVDLFIDDGLHTLEAGLCLLRHTWEHLAPQGIYVIEDVSNSDMGRYRRILSQTAARVSYVWMPGRGLGAPVDNNLILLRRRG